MRVGWAETTVGEICEFHYGRALKAQDRSGAGWPVYGSNGIVGAHDAALTQGPTIVIGRKGSCGEVHYSPTPVWPIDTTYFVDETCTSCDIKWLAHLLDALSLTRLNRAAAVPGLNREDAYRLPLLLPPLAEQRRIAGVLDQAHDLRRRHVECSAALSSLSRTVFVDIFGDPAANPKRFSNGSIDDIVASTDYGSAKKAGQTGQYPMLRMGNVTADGRVDLNDLKYVDLSDKDTDRHLVRNGDILFNRTNSAELVGKTAVFRGPEPMAYAGYLIRIRMADDRLPDYLAGFLNSGYGKAVLRRMAKSIIGMANINARELRSIKLPLPPRDLERQFEKVVATIGHHDAGMRQRLHLLDALFASLQDRAFKGNL
ncbi:MAG TPA: restriction endonuclease subunit S [Solirubrobacteraceae bacterium]|jgi:type I restriction enzyme S subunit|nr:restriction endonuclease subunit S [Solirubrobacteraceae bacterium]